jgi:hypothetical protein
MACALAGQAAAQTTITPTVSYPGTVGSVQVIEERGLNEPVPATINVSALNIEEALDLAAANNARWLSNCPGQGSPPWSAVGNVVRSDGLPRATLTCSFGGFPTATSVYTAYAERRLFAVLVGSLIDNTDGTPGGVELRGLPLGGSPFTTEAGNLAVATADLLRGARARDGRRYSAGLAIQTGGGPVVITDRVLNQALNGQDTLIFLGNL